MTFYTIGYGNRKIDDFLKVLTEAGITAVCDVRRDPYHAWSGTYTFSKLQKILSERGIHYYWLDELGNPSKENVTEFELLMEKEAEPRLTRLLALDEKSICLLCAEMDVERCHRSIIAQYLAVLGHVINNL